MDAFQTALDFILQPDIEGGYVNNPHDPGGETKYGISKRAYPNEDIAHLTKERAGALYRRDYWNALKLDAVPPALAVCAFDCAVNQGPGFCRSLLGKTKDLTEFCARRGERYALQDATDDLYALGWMRRLFRCHRLCIALEMKGGTDGAAHQGFTF